MPAPAGAPAERAGYDRAAHVGAPPSPGGRRGPAGARGGMKTGRPRPGGEGNRPLSDTQEGLVLMADSTGGRAFLVGDDVAGFVGDALHDTTGYYSLGFTPNDKTEGKLHAIEVRAKGGVKLRHRSSGDATLASIAIS